MVKDVEGGIYMIPLMTENGLCYISPSMVSNPSFYTLYITYIQYTYI